MRVRIKGKTEDQIAEAAIKNPVRQVIARKAARKGSFWHVSIRENGEYVYPGFFVRAETEDAALHIVDNYLKSTGKYATPLKGNNLDGISLNEARKRFEGAVELNL